ncbi:MAG: hypothetical protein JSV03_05095, partial [Planctomycetota bacterium]
EELAEGHFGQLEEIAAKLNLSAQQEPPPAGKLGAAVKDLVRRIYSAGLLVLCAVICFSSMNFLFTLLLTRQKAPIEIVEIPSRLDADTLQVSSEKYLGHGLASGERPRGPLAHFHQIPIWYQADPGNSCSTSGCHAPLPHGERIEVRAFLNMHSAFLDCAVCHAADADRATSARWFGLPGRDVQKPPALLRLADLLEQTSDVAAEQAPALNKQLSELLRQALIDSGHNVQLAEWLQRLTTTNTQSKLWQSIVNEMRRGIRMHEHGEYNAKIGLYSNNKIHGRPSDQQKAATTRYLSRKNQLSDDQQQSLLDTIHEGVLPDGALCTPCHSPDPKLIDFKALGYHQSRAESMKGSEIVRQVLNIEKGQPFHLPRILEDLDDR